MCVCVCVCVGSLCIDFSVLQCSILRSRARYILQWGKQALSDERLGAKLRVTENRCVLFYSFTYIYSALLPQH